MHSSRHHSQAPLVQTPEQTHNDTRAGCCVTTKPTHDAIANRAYDLYVRTGSKQGRCKQNWQQAETELQAADH